MSEPTRSPVALFGTGFDLCAAVLESGEIDPETALGNARRFGPVVLGDVELPPGSFVVLVHSSDEFLFWPKDCERASKRGEGAAIAVFEPAHGPLRTGEMYLVGEYDTRHNWLTRAKVCRVRAIAEGKLVYRDDAGALDFDDVDELEDLLVVGRLVVVKPGRSTSCGAAAAPAKPKRTPKPNKDQSAAGGNIIPFPGLKLAA